MVEKSSLMPAGISDRGVRRKVEARSGKLAQILLSPGNASGVDLAEAFAKRRECVEVTGKDIERHAAALGNRRVLRNNNPDELRHLADGIFVGANAGSYVAIER